MTARVATDVIPVRDGDFAVLDQARLRGRAAHIEGNEILESQPLSDFGRGNHAADGAGLHHRDR